jgi:hypothetical protein
VGPLISLGIGLAIGYLSLSLGDLGVLSMVLLLALLIVYYLRMRRLGSASALAIGAGGMVTLVLGSVVLGTLTDPAIHTEAPTYVAFSVGLVVVSLRVNAGQRCPLAANLSAC